MFPGYDDEIELPNPLGEGVNVVRPEEPLFARTLMLNNRAAAGASPARSMSTSTNATRTTPKRKKTFRGHHDPLPLVISRPMFARDRCTVVIKHGGDVADDNASFAAETTSAWKRTPKRYVVFSDLSEESGWAVEWGIGTILRDGDEM